MHTLVHYRDFPSCVIEKSECAVGEKEFQGTGLELCPYASMFGGSTSDNEIYI
jgi:hypothetical protein